MRGARSSAIRYARRAITAVAALSIAAPVALVMTAPAAHAAPPDPVAYWNFETSLTAPTSGGSALTATDGATLNYDNPRGIAQLMNANSHLSVDASASWLPSPSGPMSVTLWVKLSSCSASHPQIFNLQGMRQLAAPIAGQCYLKGIAGTVGGDNWQEDNTKRFPLNEWVFIAQTITPNTAGGGRMYVKSPSLGEATFTYDSANLAATGLLIGKGPEGWDPGSPGMMIDDLKVFNSQLSLADLQSLAAPAPSPHTVTFSANGGTGSMAAQTATGSTALTSNGMTAPAGKVFAGWNTAADGSGTGYADQASFPFAADATLYAQWGIPITMSCSQDTALSGAVPGDIILLTLDSGCAALPQPGGHWEYWNLNGRVSPTYAATQSGFLSAPSSGVHTSYSYASDWWVHNPGPLVTKLLATDGGGNALTNGSVVMSLDNTDGNASNNVNAKGLALVYRTSATVTFDANGGSGSMSTQASAVAANLNANAFTRSGYTFAGWNTAANGSGTAYAAGASFPFASEATLYAQWTAAPSSGGGSGSGSGGSSGGSGGSSSGGSTSASSGTMRPVTTTSVTTTAPQSDPAARPVVGQAPAAPPAVARVTLPSLTPAKITSLPLESVRTIPANDLALAPVAKIKAFTPAQLAGFTPAQRKALTLTQVAALTKAQRKALGR